uniref:Putative myoglianin n=1 Tax=Corethrella appendiculata TaxID=1370023 RepID=U5EPI3_9DIPT
MKFISFYLIIVNLFLFIILLSFSVRNVVSTVACSENKMDKNWQNLKNSSYYFYYKHDINEYENNRDNILPQLEEYDYNDDDYTDDDDQQQHHQPEATLSSSNENLNHILNEEYHLNNYYHRNKPHQDYAQRGGVNGGSSTSGISSNSNFNRNFNKFAGYSCSACQMHDVLREASLESIKAHVLMKLGFEFPPNRGTYPKVSKIILDNFYNNNTHSMDHLDNDKMLSDDPLSYFEYVDGDNAGDIDGYNHITDYIFAFPIKSDTRTSYHRRHRFHQDILHFSFDHVENSDVVGAKLYLYVYGEDWLKDNNNQFNQNNKLAKNSDTTVDSANIHNFNITIYQLVASNSKIFQYNISTYSDMIPKSRGKFISIEVTKIVKDWFQNLKLKNHGIAIKSSSSVPHKVIEIDGDAEHSPYLEILVQDKRIKRTKRSLSLNCNEHDNETRCCRYPLTVNFENFGWDWIIAPKRYEANYCAGECTMSFLPKYQHTHVWQLSTSAIPCCSPKKMSPIKLLYFDLSFNIIYSTIPNMIVEKCSCS